jgi:hypothetical protein
VSGGEAGAGFGSALHPVLDTPPNGPARQLARLPRRRRPLMVALAVAVMGVGILTSVTLARAAGHQSPVVMVTAAVPAGTTITAADLGTTTAAAGPGIQLIPARRIGELPGKVAATTLQPGTLLVPADLTTSLPPAAGQVLVPLAVRPATLPASALAPGDHVDVVATTGAQGQAASGTSRPSITAPIHGVVQSVNTVPDQDGFDIVDLLVPAASGRPLANQASTGQFALIVTYRTP